MFHMIPHDLGGSQAAGDAVGQFFDMILTDLRVSQMHQDLGMVPLRNHWNKCCDRLMQVDTACLATAALSAAPSAIPYVVCNNA